MASSRVSRGSHPFYRCLALALSLSLAGNGLFCSLALAAPEDGSVRAGDVSIRTEGNLTRIQQSSERAVIDWRSFGVAANEAVHFEQPSQTSATLNRVTGNQVSLLLGRLDANGQVFLINPHGVVFGQGAQINVGGLVASTANIDNQDFMAGRLVFSQPGERNSAVINAGEITVAEGGLVALVAPTVRNDGIISARLGRVTLAAGEVFTLDFYGDQLVNLAMSDTQVGQLYDSNGEPVIPSIAQTGTIEAAGGKVVLVTATTGKHVLDEVINLSGVIRADTVAQQGGEILLLGQGGSVNLSGSLAARGGDGLQQGGSIELFGDQVNLMSSARIDASGQAGGGTIHVGGDWQGQGETIRAETATVAAGAQLAADALSQGDGGEVVVWSDRHTSYAGTISARGGVLDGDGGRVEVSGKETLAFSGEVELGAVNGQGGSLLLDPAYLTIGVDEASLINRILSIGASATLQADIDINVNSMIDGRSRNAGGGLSLNAGNDINLNNYIVTYNGLVALNAGGDINIAPGYGVFTGAAPLRATSRNSVSNVGLVSANLLHLTSTSGDVNIAVGIDETIGNVVIDAANDVNITVPVVNLKNGSSLTATARGGDVNVNDQIDGGGGVSGGSVTLTATTGNVAINDHVVTNDGPITVTAGGTINQLSAGLDSYGAPMTMQLRSGNGDIAVSSGNTMSLGSLVTTGAISVTSIAGDVNIDVPIYETVGNATVAAGGAININQVVANTTTGADLTMTAGSDIVVNAKVGPWDRSTGTTLNRDALPGGDISLNAGGNIDINTDIASYKGSLTSTDDASIRLISSGGTIDLAAGMKVQSDGGSIYVSSFGNLQNAFAPAAPNDPVNMGYLTTGALTLISTNGNVDINQTIPDTTGAITIEAGDRINVNQRIYSNSADITLIAGAGGIYLNPADDPNPDWTQTTYYLSDIDARGGDLWIEAIGDIHIAGVRTDANLTIKSTAGWLDGDGLDNIISSRDGSGNTVGNGLPNRIDLAGALGIVDFTTASSPNVHAISNQGSVTNLSVYFPGTLEIIAKNDIFIGGPIGTNVNLYAGRDISLSSVTTGDILAKAGRTLSVAGGSPLISDPIWAYPSILADSINFSAGIDPFAGLTNPIAGVSPPAWQGSYGATSGDVSIANYAWVAGTGGMSVTATDTIDLTPVHVSYYLNTTAETLDLRQTQQPFILTAGGDITLQQIETMGPVALTSASGDITVATTIGPHVSVETPADNMWNPNDKGVASVSIIANGDGATITMKEARAVGNITIAATSTNAAAPGLVGYSNEFVPAAGVGFETASGTVTIYDQFNGATYNYHLSNVASPASYDYLTTISPNIKTRLPLPPLSGPAISAGPTHAGPGAPPLPGAPPPGAPGYASVAGTTAPGGSGDALLEIFVPEPSRQISEQGENVAANLLTEEEEKALASTQQAAPGEGQATVNPLAFDTLSGAFLVFAGGRGEASDEERRR